MRQRTLLVGASVVIGITAIGAMASAGGGGGLRALHARFARALHPAMEAGFARHLDQVADALELTPAQRGQVAAVLQARFDATLAAVRAVLDAHARPFAEVLGTPEDPAAIHGAAAELAAAQEQMLLQVGGLRGAVLAVLDADQRAKLAAMHGAGDLRALLEDHFTQVRQGALIWIARQDGASGGAPGK